MLNITSYNLVIRCLLRNTAQSKESPETPIKCLLHNEWGIMRAQIGVEHGYRVFTGSGFKTISAFINETCQPTFYAVERMAQRGYKKPLKTYKKY